MWGREDKTVSDMQEQTLLFQIQRTDQVYAKATRTRGLERKGWGCKVYSTRQKWVLLYSIKHGKLGETFSNTHLPTTIVVVFFFVCICVCVFVLLLFLFVCFCLF